MSESQRPRLHVAQPADFTFGDLAAELSADYGLILDEWQRLVLDDWLARSGSRWTHLSCGLSCPRQNGKNGILEVRELFGTVGRGEKILHTAHEVKTARKAFKRLQYFFGRSVNDRGAKFPELNARVVELRNVNGQEAIFLDNGGSVEIIARSKNSGRGFTADVLVMDEAQEMSDEDIEALMPTTSAAPLGDPQWIYTGTPPGPKVNGEVFTRRRTEALERPVRACWHEWSAADPGEPVDLDDRDSWRRNNPGMDPGRLQEEVVEGERSTFSDDGFARERLGVWSRSGGQQMWLTIPEAPWGAVADQYHQATGRLAYALDVDTNAKGEEWCSIGTSDGVHLEIVNPPDVGPGTEWVVPLVVARRDRFDEIGIDPSGPAGKLIKPLTEAGIQVRKLKAEEVVQASGQLLDGVLVGTVRHIDQPRLNRAAASAEKRDVGDGAWRFSRTRSSGDIGPVMAVAFARFLAGEGSESDYFEI